MGVVLACAWRPRGDVARWQSAWPLLAAIYDRVVIGAPVDANLTEVAAFQDAVSAFGSAAPAVELAPRRFLARPTALRLALQAEAAHVHYADGDRLLRWVATHPDELRAVVRELQEVDCLILGRTPRAFRTHPQTMQQTEAIINAVASHLLGEAVDLGGGSRGLSRAAVEAVLAHAIPERYGDAEWPIITRRLGLSVAYRAVDGLDWETPDRTFGGTATDAQQRELAAAYGERADQWEARVRTARDIVEEALDATTRPLPPS